MTDAFLMKCKYTTRLGIDSYMNKLQAMLAVAAICLLPGCVGTRDNEQHDHADIVDYGSRGIDVEITKRMWDGFWGAEGYIGYKNEHYKAGLQGDGPVFINPPFQDNPPDIYCIGTITVDRQHGKVTVNMRRIVSKPGERQRTQPHPANGTYPIESTRYDHTGRPLESGLPPF